MASGLLKSKVVDKTKILRERVIIYGWGAVQIKGGINFSASKLRGGGKISVQAFRGGGQNLRNIPP